ncbi:N-acylneuraminate-9-phosphatase [Aureococcus anophagefferens]|nr:N-acylneuraminate-9-phosphatase [Aureococcus anophagefferens]
MRLCFNAAAIRAVSFDVTGTLLFHKESIAKTYADAAVWARLDDPPTAEELKPAFKRAYKSACLERPCFGYDAGGEKAWWAYAFYGSREGYEPLPDARPALDALRDRGLALGVTSNTPARTTDSVLPMLGLHDHFCFFASSSDLGVEKPDAGIFEAALERARFWCGADLAPHEVLHVGDSFGRDYLGARAFGFQALHLDRSGNELVVKYNDWILPGEFDEDEAKRCTITDLGAIVAYVEAGASW